MSSRRVVRTTHFPHHGGHVGKRASESPHAVTIRSRTGRPRLAVTTTVFGRTKLRTYDHVITALGVMFGASTVAFWAINRDEAAVSKRHRTMAIPLAWERRIGDYYWNSLISSSTCSSSSSSATKSKSNVIAIDGSVEPAPINRELSIPSSSANSPNVYDVRFLRKTTRNDDEEDALVRAIRKICTRLIDTAETKHLTSPDAASHQPLFKWRIMIVESPQINAFCAPGGVLVIYTGLIEFYSREAREGRIPDLTDALATVFAHELSHGICRHGMEKLSWLPIQIPFIFFASTSEILMDPFIYIFKLPHSRLTECEVGSLLLAEAGFNVRNAPRALKVLDNRSGMVVEFTSTHPNAENRAAHVEKTMVELQAIYEENRRQFEAKEEVFKCKLPGPSRNETIEFELVA